MDDITLEQVIAFHEQVMKIEGGDDRILSEANLHQMIFLTNRIDEVYSRAAFAFFTLVAYPAFREGNGQTARCVAEMILSNNGCSFPEKDNDMSGLVEGIASFTIEQDDIEEWLRSRFKKI